MDKEKMITEQYEYKEVGNTGWLKLTKIDKKEGNLKMKMKDYREQETFTDLRKYLEIQRANIDLLLDEIGIYTCRNDDDQYFDETFSIHCYNRDDFIIFDYKRTVQNNNIRESIQKVLEILKKGDN